MQDNLSKFSTNHTLTFGGYAEKYHSDNVFFGCCPQGAWAYNSLADFYADANGYLANTNRTTTTVAGKLFQIRWSNIAGKEKPEQPLDVWYTAGYAQDEWRPRRNLTGHRRGPRRRVAVQEHRLSQRRRRRADLPRPERQGGEIRHRQHAGYEGALVAARRRQLRRVRRSDDAARGGSGLFSGRPAYVWISNQIGNTGVLIGEIRVPDPGTAFPFTPDPSRYKPAATGANAASYALNVTDTEFKFPQVWRSNVAVDRKLPLGITSTTELLYAKEVNGIYYIDANLPAAQSAFAGVDARPRWVGEPCAALGQTSGNCVTRLNNQIGNAVTNNYVLLNDSQGSSWNFAQSLQKNTRFGLTMRGAYSYGISRTISDPESTAATSFARNSNSADPNNPGARISMWAPGHRVFALVNFSHEYFNIGATSISLFYEARNSTINSSSRLSYVFAGDLNSDGVSANDLIYIPRSTSEMNFSTFAAGGRTFTADEQAAAFEAYIGQDSYLRKHRGEYAERNGVLMPMFNSVDLSITQDVFHNLGGQRNGFQVRLDFLNFGNLLNHEWGVAQRPIAAVNTNQQLQILTNPGVDAQGRATYRLATVNNQLITKTYQTSATTGDVYQFMISLRYSFN
jgi:hypothetical protein